MRGSVPEQQITPQLAVKVAPDVVSPQGQQQLQLKRLAAQKVKDMLDQAFKMAASTIPGATFNSRIKNMDVAQRKIIQKRVEGRKYGMDNLNDLYGGRFTVEKPEDFKKVKQELSQMEDAGLFKIKKQETVRVGNYEAYHSDIVAPDGTKAEVQIHLPQSESESVSNHDLRALYGEKPPTPIRKLVDMQADINDKMPNGKARAITQALQLLHKMNGDKPIPPELTASILQQARQ